uniref:Oligopeptide/dipeptide ABC transporter C-terminal domain-containing protein n=1 Tax=Candidatus Methanophagaceae archaeon ANME-1 ERB6 TaxID=2759912 RepID=A0A7G9YWQ5_9EURY|nr:hypothetical protein DJCILHOG_00021 [Methanosarcinales archaeon ANME-1 ERB6]QNO52572.1 hypothetical protein NBNHMHLL_00004 [Methanosarcinales archaeon ANME-1 ERB6]QNO53371.1 hypothetical protein KFLEFLPM_00025 [Methanosarcinales archaeon ANME-1 ERB6]
MYQGKIVEIGNAKDIFGDARHPYTNTLISLASSGDQVISDGDMKNVSDYPSGCVFYQRCSFSTGICREKEPEMVEIGREHQVLCHCIT